MNRREQAVALYKSGLSTVVIGDRLGVRTETVRRWLIKAGVPRRPRYEYPTKPTPSWEEYFGSRVKKEGDCLVWTGRRDRRNYGGCDAVFAPGIFYAHRMSWFLANGPFDLDLCVLHRCDNPPCVNPKHLFLGTRTDNHRDMRAKGRHKMPDQRGEANPSARLTEDDVRRILRMSRSGRITHEEIAKEFGVARTAVSRIISGDRWGHLQPQKQEAAE